MVTTARAFQAYGEVDLLTGGGPQPSNPTTTIPYFIYGQNSPIRNDVGLQAGVGGAVVPPPARALRRPTGRASDGGCTMSDLTANIDGPVDPAAVDVVDLHGRPSRARAFDEPVGWRRVGRYLLLALVTVVVVFPMYTTIVASLKPGDEVLKNPLLPTGFTLDVYRDAWTSGRLGRYLLNSLVVAVIVTIAQVVTSVLAAYAFAILQFPGKRLLFVAVHRHAARARRGDRRRQLPDRRRTRLDQHVHGAVRPVPRHRVRDLPAPPGVHDAAARPARRGGDRRCRATGVSCATSPSRSSVRRIGALALFSFLGTWNQYLWPNLVVTEQDMNTVQSGLRAPQQVEPRPTEPRDGGHGDRRACRSSSRCSSSNASSSAASPPER